GSPPTTARSQDAAWPAMTASPRNRPGPATAPAGRSSKTCLTTVGGPLWPRSATVHHKAAAGRPCRGRCVVCLIHRARCPAGSRALTNHDSYPQPVTGSACAARYREASGRGIERDHPERFRVSRPGHADYAPAPGGVIRSSPLSVMTETVLVADGLVGTVTCS